MSQVAAVELEVDRPQLIQLCPEEGWAPTPSTFPTGSSRQEASLYLSTPKKTQITTDYHVFQRPHFSPFSASKEENTSF